MEGRTGDGYSLKNKREKKKEEYHICRYCNTKMDIILKPDEDGQCPYCYFKEHKRKSEMNEWWLEKDKVYK